MYLPRRLARRLPTSACSQYRRASVHPQLRPHWQTRSRACDLLCCPCRHAAKDCHHLLGTWARGGPPRRGRCLRHLSLYASLSLLLSASVDMPRRLLVAHKPGCALRAWCPDRAAEERARVGAGAIERDRDECATGSVRDVVVAAGRVVDAVAAG